MLRALLVVSEVRIADRITAAWRELHEALDREIHEAERRRDRLHWRQSDQVAVACCHAARELADKLWEERQGANEALAECKDITDRLSSRLGVELTGESSEVSDTRAALVVLNEGLQPARQRFDTLISNDQEALHHLAQHEERWRHSTDPGITLEQIDGMEQDAFDDAIKQALERSGFQASWRQARVIEVTDDGEAGLVYCANVNRPAREDLTQVRAILTAQRLARQRDLRRVMVVTNQRFISRLANRLMDKTTPSVVLVQRFALQQWLEWGMPLRDVLAAA